MIKIGGKQAFTLLSSQIVLANYSHTGCKVFVCLSVSISRLACPINSTSDQCDFMLCRWYASDQYLKGEGHGRSLSQRWRSWQITISKVKVLANHLSQRWRSWHITISKVKVMADHCLKGEGNGRSLSQRWKSWQITISKVKVMADHYLKGEGHVRSLSQRWMSWQITISKVKVMADH